MEQAESKIPVRGPRFSSLFLGNWRNFRKVDIRLQERVFLVGPNASGKSNLLDVFRFLNNLVSVGGGLQDAVSRRGGVKMLRSLVARQNPDIAIRVGMIGLNGGAETEYELHFAQDSQKRAVVKKEIVRRGDQVLLNRPDKDDKEDSARLTQTFLEQVNVNKSFRDVADFFGAIRYLHIVPQLVREPERSAGKKEDPFGGDFLHRIATEQPRTRTARLREIGKALKVAVPQLTDIELTQDKNGAPHLRGNYEHWRPQGAWQTEEHFSDGTLRLLGLLWSVLAGRGPLLLEEPELSLHPKVVQFLPAIFNRANRRLGRQFILSTHSSDLLKDEGIGLDEVMLLDPKGEGTRVDPASSVKEIVALLEGGVPLGEAVMPRVSPVNANQLTLFPN